MSISCHTSTCCYELFLQITWPNIHLFASPKLPTLASIIASSDEHFLSRSLLDSFDAHEAIDLRHPQVVDSRPSSASNIMSQQHLPDPDAPSFTRPDLLVSSHHTLTAPQQPQGPPDSLYSSLYSQSAHDAFLDLPDSSLIPASFGAHSLRTANTIGTQTGLNSIKQRPATDADTFRSLDLNAQLQVGPSNSDLSSNVLAEAASATGPASGLPPRRANVDYGMLPQLNTPLIPLNHISPQPLQAPAPTLTALPMAPSNLPASTIQSSAGSGPLTPMPQSGVMHSTQPPLNQQQILQLITSQSPSQSPAAAAQLAQLLQSPNAQPILTQLAAMMGSAQAAPPPTQTQEEISTIFVVGFPDDMTVSYQLLNSVQL